MVAFRNHPKLDHVSIQIEAYGFGVPPFYETPIWWHDFFWYVAVSLSDPGPASGGLFSRWFAWPHVVLADRITAFFGKCPFEGLGICSHQYPELDPLSHSFPPWLWSGDTSWHSEVSSTKWMLILFQGLVALRQHLFWTSAFALPTASAKKAYSVYQPRNQCRWNLKRRQRRAFFWDVFFPVHRHWWGQHQDGIRRGNQTIGYCPHFGDSLLIINHPIWYCPLAISHLVWTLSLHLYYYLSMRISALRNHCLTDRKLGKVWWMFRPMAINAGILDATFLKLFMFGSCVRRTMERLKGACLQCPKKSGLGGLQLTLWSRFNLKPLTSRFQHGSNFGIPPWINEGKWMAYALVLNMPPISDSDRSQRQLWTWWTKICWSPWPTLSSRRARKFQVERRQRLGHDDTMTES